MAEVVTTYGGISTLVGDVARVSDLSWSTAWPYGCFEASFTLDLDANASVPAALRIGADVAIWDGPVRVWSGYLSELDTDTPWTVHAKGMYSLVLGDGAYLALAATGAPTSTPKTAVDQAISRGWAVTNGITGLPTTPFSSMDETIATNTVGSLLDAYAASINQRWGVNEDRLLTMSADVTTPDWVLLNRDAIRGVADDEYVTDIYARYVLTTDATTGDPTAWGIAHVGSGTGAGRREEPLDLTTLGLMTSTAATNMAQARLDQADRRMGYTAPIVASAGELVRDGGAPARLGLVKAGQMLRAFAVADVRGQVALGLTQDVLIGRTQYTDGDSTVTLTPVDMVPRSLSDVLAAPPSPPETFDGTAA